MAWKYLGVEMVVVGFHHHWLNGIDFIGESRKRSEMSRYHVGGKEVDIVDLLRKRHWGWRLDMWPFVTLYGIWMAAVVRSLDIVDASIVLGSSTTFHVLVFLFTVWSVDFKRFIQYFKFLFI